MARAQFASRFITDSLHFTPSTHDSNMGNSFSHALVSTAVFAYGFFTVVLYGLIALAKGTYFKRPTENEKRDLQLGELCIHHYEGSLLIL